MSDKTGLQIKIKTTKGEILIPESTGLTLKSDENLILPFNFDLGGVNLNYSTAQLITRTGDDKNPSFIFFMTGDIPAQFSISNANVSKITTRFCDKNSDNTRCLVSCRSFSEFRIKRKTGGEITVLVIDKNLALKSWLISIKGIKYLVFSEALLMNNNDALEFYKTGSGSFDILVYPKLNLKPEVEEGTVINLSGKNPLMSEFRVDLPQVKFDIANERYGENKLQLTLPESLPKELNDVFIKIDYTGDTGMSFMNGNIVDDHFFYGQPWVIGLRKFYDLSDHKKMIFYFRPMYKNATYLIDLDKRLIPDFSGSGTYLKINKVETIPEFHGFIRF
jgi:hypothetical protein